ncbi:alpha/beta fold hydrolase [Microbacterium sp.]|uniref:alpha/beta fold hydrolase n=1 Tax=Microbacterium sp. TaxID=51671 RepID=UPI0039E71388
MTTSGASRLVRTLAASTPGLRRVRRPATAASPAFDLAYARTGPRTATPTVVIPGGPGLASILPYRALRHRAAARGLDVIMVEHRGVGLSRADPAGRALPPSAMRVTDAIDDLAAVLDHEGVDAAFVSGSSYGSYVASGFGVRHPDRVAGMLLDSALQSAHDLPLERTRIRELFWDPDTVEAAAVRRLVEDGADQRRLLDVVRAAYEVGGPALLLPLLTRRLRGRRDAVWAVLETYASRSASILRVPGVYEFDVVGALAFRELNYGAPPDGGPLDPALTYAPIADRFPAFAGEPFDLPALTARFPWPMVLLVGERDLRTPPAIAERVASTAHDAVLTRIDNGHSALESHPLALMHTLGRLVAGEQRLLPAEGAAMDRMPHRGLVARFPDMLLAGVRLRRALRR